MGLFKELDWRSIRVRLDEIMEGSKNSRFKNNEYAGYYDELLTELANVAGDLWDDLWEIDEQISFRNIPWKARKYSGTEDARYWFNTAALTLTETDISALFKGENDFDDYECLEDYEKEKKKRLNMLERLPKKDFIWLIQTVSNTIIRYIEICSAWDEIVGIIDELESRQSFIKGRERLKEPRTAYL